jgi:hypothetical protein
MNNNRVPPLVVTPNVLFQTPYSLFDLFAVTYDSIIYVPIVIPVIIKSVCDVPVVVTVFFLS